MAIDWSRGYSCTWHAYEVGTDTWADGAEISDIESANIERSNDGNTSLIESGDFRLIVPIGTEWNERYLRLVMIAEQSGVQERVNVCTLLCSTMSGEIDKRADTLKVIGRSVLFPASTARIDTGSYAPAGSDGAELAARMLREVISAPVSIDGSFELSAHVVYNINDTILSVVWDLLDAGNFGIRIFGDGTVHIGPKPTKPSLELNQASIRLLHTLMPHELDWSDVPNRYVAIEGDEIAEATNDDPNSLTSTVMRGYRHDAIDTSPVRIGGETLAAYCERKLEENSIAYDTREWSREWWPDVLPGDIVRASLSHVGIEGDYRVARQRLTCGKGIVIEEQARMEVCSWQRR